MNRGLFYLALIMVPVTITIFFVEPLLLAIGQPEKVAGIAQDYLITQLPGVYLNVLNNALGKLVTNYGHTEIGLYSSIFSLLVNLAANYYFVIYLQLGIVGTGYACILSFLASTIMLLVYLNYSEMRTAIVCPDSRVFEDSGEFLSIAIPNVAMACLDWWVFELMIVFSGWIGVKEQATMIIMLNIVTMFGMVAVGL